MSSIYILDENKKDREYLELYLKLEDHDVTCFATVEDFESALANTLPPDLIILELHYEQNNGFFIAKQITRSPFFFISADSTQSDRIMALEMGAEDFVSKPYSPREVVLRVKNILKNLNSKQILQNTILASEKWSCMEDVMTVNKKTHILDINGVQIELTPVQWKIIVYLMDNYKSPVSRDEIKSDSLNHHLNFSAQTLNSHIKNLRMKLGYHWIKTVWNYGYQFKGTPCKQN